MGSGPKERRLAQIGLANLFLMLAFVLQLFSPAPAVLFYGLGILRFYSQSTISSWYEVWVFVGSQLLLLGMVLLCLMEGIRGLRQRRNGAAIAITLSMVWLFTFGVVYFGRIVSEV